MVADRAARPPSVERLLAAVRPRRPAGQDHEALAEAARSVLAEERDRLADGVSASSLAALADALVGRLDGWARSPLEPTIHATGVVVRTHLGGAPWGGG